MARSLTLKATAVIFEGRAKQPRIISSSKLKRVQGLSTRHCFSARTLCKLRTSCGPRRATLLVSFLFSSLFLTSPLSLCAWTLPRGALSTLRVTPFSLPGGFLAAARTPSLCRRLPGIGDERRRRHRGLLRQPYCRSVPIIY